jgi:pimeloyl-ACP methyl ester carboxylesterase
MTPMIRYTLALALPFCMAGAAAASELPGDVGYSIALAGGAHQHLLYESPAHPRGSIVMLPGGSGDVGVERGGTVRHDDNFVVRTRAMWTARGYAVVIPDTIDRANLRGLRDSAAYADVVTRLVAFAHAQARGPVFLLGTSQGSIAAMNGAAHARPGSVAGVVLTESVTVQGGSGETVFDADPQDVRIPALIVANRDDACRVAPPANAVRIKQALTHAPDVRIAYVSGGETRSDNACSSRTPHGYLGIEDQVVGIIAAWLARVGGR